MAEAAYELRLRGPLPQSATTMLEEMDMRCDTLFSGMVEDQAALHGLLDRIRDAGLELVELHRVTAIPASAPLEGDEGAR